MTNYELVKRRKRLPECILPIALLLAALALGYVLGDEHGSEWNPTNYDCVFEEPE